ncbi:unnamed protein product [Ceutorhynchus assimilis]|uniref:Sugar transporter SWEET n=1 Tax=Ceutorhynchus assimilis TaxID=467358 RepID=A0A9N9MH19_9CUCU|nr:unnamed protein product [Ceutorhynchus assimilis]
MDTISNSLQPYKEWVARVAAAATILQFFAGVPICWEIHKKKSTRGYSALPFIGGTAVGVLFLQYGLILGDQTMVLVNIVAIFLNAVYTGFYYTKAEDKNGEVLKPMAYAVALVAMLIGYIRLESPNNVEFRFGLVLMILMLTLLGVPLLDLREIIRKKDASSIPLPMTVMGAIVTFLWALYGIILHNNFLLVQNLIGFILCCVQLGLIVFYRRSKTETAADQAQGS